MALELKLVREIERPSRALHDLFSCPCSVIFECVNLLGVGVVGFTCVATSTWLQVSEARPATRPARMRASLASSLLPTLARSIIVMPSSRSAPVPPYISFLFHRPPLPLFPPFSVLPSASPCIRSLARSSPPHPSFLPSSAFQIFLPLLGLLVQ